MIYLITENFVSEKSDPMKTSDYITEDLLFELNSDGKFSSADVLLMRKWMLGENAVIDSSAADMDDNSKVNIADYVQLMNILLNIQER